MIENKSAKIMKTDEIAENLKNKGIISDISGFKRAMEEYVRKNKDPENKVDNWIKVLDDLVEWAQENDIEEVRNMETVTIADLRGVIQYCNPSERAIIELMVSSGMSTSDIIKLNFRDFLQSIVGYLDMDAVDSQSESCVYQIAEYLERADDLIGVWYLERPKTGRRYFTFNTSESTESLVDYLIDIQNIQGLISLNDPLFTDGYGNRLSKTDISNILRKIGNQINKKVNSHLLRRLFAATLVENGVHPFFIDMVLGHKICPVLKAYIKYDISLLKETYTEIEGELSLETEYLSSVEYIQLLKSSLFKGDSDD